MEKLRVGIIGATGMVGQRFIKLLDNHPFFEVKVLAASKNSAGKIYSEAVVDRWKMETPIPDYAKEIIVLDIYKIEDISKYVDLVFCAVDMPKEEIKRLEEEYAKSEVVVVSNNSAHRWTDDVPMIIPEINPNHLEVIRHQKKRLNTENGFIVVKPNCSIQSYAPVIAALKEFEPTEVMVSTYQAISGAGKTFDTWEKMIGNIIPFIAGEEEKSEREPQKILGDVIDGKIVENTGILISAQCIRVPVLNGHTATVAIKFKNKPTKAEILEKLITYSGQPQEYELPSAPKQFIHYFTEDNRPQVNLDVNNEKGMAISIGRLREDNIFDYKFVGLSHNTIRGAAGGAVLIAELLYAKRMVSRRQDVIS